MHSYNMAEQQVGHLLFTYGKMDKPRVAVVSSMSNSSVISNNKPGLNFSETPIYSIHSYIYYMPPQIDKTMSVSGDTHKHNCP